MNSCAYCGSSESLTEIHVEINRQSPRGEFREDVPVIRYVCPDPECVREAEVSGAVWPQGGGR